MYVLQQFYNLFLGLLTQIPCPVLGVGPLTLSGCGVLHTVEMNARKLDTVPELISSITSQNLRNITFRFSSLGLENWVGVDRAFSDLVARNGLLEDNIKVTVEIDPDPDLHSTGECKTIFVGVLSGFRKVGRVVLVEEDSERADVVHDSRNTGMHCMRQGCQSIRSA